MAVWSRVRRLALGAPRDVRDPHAFEKVSLITLLAWVGLGADGLSSSAYGPDEAFRALGEHTGLAFFLALATACTVFIISYGYSRIIEQFPSGGGGYVVSTRLLGQKTGLVSGAALLVDYVLTITTSMASGADAIFSFLPAHVHAWKLPITFVGLGILTLLNLRGVKESVTALVPIFTVFLVTHAILLIVSIGGHLGAVTEVSHEVRSNVGETVGALGAFGALKLFLHSYSMGGGTYTGIEAVSNGVPMMREPRVQTAQRTMLLMAFSLAITAGGIILAYLLMHAHPEPGKTMNAVLLERAAGGWSPGGVPLGKGFMVVTLLSEGTLLFVAAQAGFLDGPRVMANMATDSWLPHRFAALSDRLAMNNGIMLMAGAAAGALLYTRGNVSKLVVMYSINVFLTFSLSNLAMCRHWLRDRALHPRTWWQHLPAHVIALVLCATILVVTVLEKFSEGGWLTLLVTAFLVGVCLLIRRHYELVVEALKQLDLALPSPAEVEHLLPNEPRLEIAPYDEGPTRVCREHHNVKDPDPRAHVAILFVAGYSGLGRHAVLTLLRLFPRYFGGIVFVSVAILDSEVFKGADQVQALERRTRETLMKYERFAQSLGLTAASAFSVGTEVPVESERIARDLILRYPGALFVGGQLIFAEETLWTRILHNATAFMVQKRLQHRGIPMIVLPVRLDIDAPRAIATPELTAGVYRT